MIRMSKKTKYYMRGVGVGILVCALILIISRINKPAEISDEEIISRARALGMIESGEQSLTEATGVSDVSAGDSEPAYVSPVVLPDEVETAEPMVTDPVTDEEHQPDEEATSSPEPEVSPEPSSEPSASPETSPEPESTAEPSPESSPEPVVSQPVTDGSYVVLTVNRGNSSDTVAKRAEELGLVTDYRDFDAYLVRNGYANRIRVGSFQIPVGATYEEIAKAIT